MTWSPRRLAELADTSRRTVRHYHEIGLLPEPERQRNGYRQYGVAHLIRLLRVRRLTQLGLSLPQIAQLGDADEHPADALRALDAELARRVEELQRTRLELAGMLERAAPTDLPAEFAVQVRGLPAVERALLVVLSRLVGGEALHAYLAMMPAYRDDVSTGAFDALPHDADVQSRSTVAAAMAVQARHLADRYPDAFRTVEADLGRGPVPKRKIIHQAAGNLYNPAQLDVLSQLVQLKGRPSPHFEPARAAQQQKPPVMS